MTQRTGLRLRPGAFVVAVIVLDLMIVGCSEDEMPSTASLLVSSTRPIPAAIPKATQTTQPTPAVKATKTPVPKPRNTPPTLDRFAGLRSTKVAWSGSGKLRVVPGKTAAPGKGRLYRFRVEVEVGLNLDQAAFAAFVLTTLNDKRSWAENGRRQFVRTDGPADFRVVLASPKTSAAMCQPLRTFGKLSCRNRDAAVLTMYRWTKAMPEYTGNHNGYRQYLINHEVGHLLGHGHEYCAGRGRMAPVMMQQTKGLKGCTPNPWPHP